MKAKFAGIDARFLAELQRSLQIDDIRAKPFDPTIPHILLDDSAERGLPLAEALSLRRHRRELYRAWLRELGVLKHGIQDVRLRAGSVPFSQILRLDAQFRWGIARLTWIGWLHFLGGAKLDRLAVDIVRSLATCPAVAARA